MNPEVVYIKDTSLSRAWARAFLQTLSREHCDLSPLVVSVSGYVNDEPQEDLAFRGELDVFLGSFRPKRGSAPLPTTTESASVIFPYRTWQRKERPPRHEFYAWYLDHRMPRLVARNRRNQYGTYFQRMIAFDASPVSDRRRKMPAAESKNQLEGIIKQWEERAASGGGRPRRSALQAVVVDPRRDLTGQALRGFPCLQQISFTYDDDGGLAVNAYYPTQYIVDRGYGNYLGLSHLGAFMAHELHLSMVRLNCFVAHPDLGSPSRAALKRIIGLAEALASTALED